ncbi:DivIVA domain-containing protein [Nocardiopsis sp. RSe5-2]|uniref:Cell wall synthesis protein Wag31 n=1 Tax=Nocardiopsis endophytica TaxID=3018445 RepID=A0ABT4UCC2_9ACTN|nr:DivIVA domain-containing protein [Nocardiopsis endophytica]MDA2814575.1 DivIVA domain-containing protein [Nocardiopsis endophytica]
MPLTPADIRNKRFTLVRLRPGYNEDDVDALLDRIEEAFAALQRGRAEEPVITASEVEESVFRGTRLTPGYKEDEVDDFLDQVVSELRAAGLSRPGDMPRPGAGATAAPVDAGAPVPPPPPPPVRGGSGAASGDAGAPRPPHGAARGAMTPEQVRNKRFATTRLTTGYNEDEVDAFLDSAEVTLGALLDGRPDRALLSAADVERVRFSTTRARPGYDPAQVDAFLDELATELRRHETGGH